MVRWVLTRFCVNFHLQAKRHFKYWMLRVIVQARKHRDKITAMPYLLLWWTTITQPNLALHSLLRSRSSSEVNSSPGSSYIYIELRAAVHSVQPNHPRWPVSSLWCSFTSARDQCTIFTAWCDVWYHIQHKMESLWNILWGYHIWNYFTHYGPHVLNSHQKNMPVLSIFHNKTLWALGHN